MEIKGTSRFFSSFGRLFLPFPCLEDAQKEEESWFLSNISFSKFSRIQVPFISIWIHLNFERKYFRGLKPRVSFYEAINKRGPLEREGRGKASLINASYKRDVALKGPQIPL